MYKQPKHTSNATAVISAMLLMAGGVAQAAPLSVTNTFVATQPATAASVNQNFSDTEAAVNDNNTRVTTNEAGISTNAGTIGTNTGNITSNSGTIGTNTGNITTNTGAISTNTGGISTNSGLIGTNTTTIGDNIADIIDHETRITALESGGGGGGAGQTTVVVGCDVNADALLDPPISGNFTANTTYEITGPCNGPIAVNANNAWFIGQDPAAAIVLPATADPFNGAILVDGASDVRIENLTIDASAWANVSAEGSDSAGLYARQAFVKLTDVDVTGGLYGISAFRNALIRLEGTINITNFVNEGLGAGDHSNIQIRGTSPVVTVSTTNTAADSFTNGDYIVGLSTWRQGVIESRGVTNISVPAGREAIGNSGQSHVRLKAGGTIVGDISSGNLSNTTIIDATITGNLNASDGSILSVSGSTVAGDIQVRDNSKLDMNATDQSGGGIVAFMNSTVIIGNNVLTPMSIGPVEAIAESVVQFRNGEISVGNDGQTSIMCELGSSIAVGDLNGHPDFSTSMGVELVENCYLGFFNGTISGDIQVSDNSTLTIEAYGADGTSATVSGNVVINASSAALIDGDTASITGNVLVQRSSHASLRSGAMVSGDFQVRAGSGMDVQNSSPGIIGGTLECDTYSGNYLDIFPQSQDVANLYVVDFNITPNTDDQYCGFVYP